MPEKPNHKKRAVVAEKPTGIERAGVVEKPKEGQRAKKEKPPIDAERAKHGEAPKTTKRARHTDKPIQTERATQTNQPQAGKRADEFKKPVIFKRARVREKPIGEKRAKAAKKPALPKRAVPWNHTSPLPNQRHERFAEMIAEGRGPSSAYLAVFHETSSRDSCAAAASRLLTDVNVAARVKYLSGVILENAITGAAVTKERVLTELARVAYANMDDHMEIGPDGLPRLNWKALTREQKAALAEVTVETYTKRGRGEDDEPEEVTKVKFKLHPKVPALTELGRHLKLFTDKVEWENRESPEVTARRERGIRLLTALLEEKARGRLPPALNNVLTDWAGGGKVIEGKVEAAKR